MVMMNSRTASRKGGEPMEKRQKVVLYCFMVLFVVLDFGPVLYWLGRAFGWW